LECKREVDNWRVEKINKDQFHNLYSSDVTRVFKLRGGRKRRGTFAGLNWLSTDLNGAIFSKNNHLHAVRQQAYISSVLLQTE
jgi:hypothetical protein